MTIWYLRHYVGVERRSRTSVDQGQVSKNKKQCIACAHGVGPRTTVDYTSIKTVFSNTYLYLSYKE